jgi:chemotaxis family two-component system response regulator Rcp1
MSKKFSILLMEDNPGDVRLLRLALSTAGVECEFAVIGDGAKAIEFVQRCTVVETRLQPDLAILDMDLPKHDGLAILEALRAAEPLASLPVVILTSSPNLRELPKLQSLGITRHLTKPPDLDAFMGLGRVIKGLLEGGG